MPRSLQDVLRAGAERSRANAPRVIQTRLEREEEIREENRRFRNATSIPEAAKEVKHAWNRLWEETHNEVDFVRGARDCFAEREDLWKQVKGMEALRETSLVYKKLYNDLQEKHVGILGRLMYSQNEEKLKERIFAGNANEARLKGDMDAALDFEKRRIMARNEIQNLDYIMYGGANRYEATPEPQAGERRNQLMGMQLGADSRRNQLMGMRRNLEQTQAEERLYQLEADEARQMGQVERERTSEAKLREAQAKAKTLQRFIEVAEAEDRERTQAEERPYENEGAEVGKVGW